MIGRGLHVAGGLGVGDQLIESFANAGGFDRLPQRRNLLAHRPIEPVQHARQRLDKCQHAAAQAVGDGGVLRLHGDRFVVGRVAPCASPRLVLRPNAPTSDAAVADEVFEQVDLVAVEPGEAALEEGKGRVVGPAEGGDAQQAAGESNHRPVLRGSASVGEAAQAVVA